MVMQRPPKPPEQPLRPPQKYPVGNYPSQLPPTGDIPPELWAVLGIGGSQDVGARQISLLNFLDFWQKTNPQGLYETQFTDYLVKLYQDKEQQLVKEYTQTSSDDDELALQDYRDKERKLRQLIEDYDKQMQFKRDMNFPIQDMPFYDEIQKQGNIGFTPSIQKAYNEFTTQRQVEQQVAQKEQQDYEQKYRDWYGETTAKPIAENQQQRLDEYQQAKLAAQYPTGANRRIVLEAVKKGILTEEEAFGPQSGWTPQPTGGIGGRTTTGGMQGTDRGTTAIQNLKTFIGKAQQAGIDTTQAMATYQQNAFAGGNDAVIQREVEQLNTALTQTEAANRTRQSNVLASQYPDIFKMYAAERQQGFAGATPGAGWESGFANWATTKGDENNPLTPQQTTAQQKMRDIQLGNWEKYGNIYGAYQDYVNTGKDESVMPIESWIENNPQIKLAWQYAQERRVPRQQPYARWR